MSKERLFVVVEGRVLDPSFYDRICAANPKAASGGWIIRPIDTITMPSGQPQKGKGAVLALFRYTRRMGHLSQRSSSGVHNILFVVDRDLDSVTGRTSRSSHLVYTAARDVEAEIHLHGDQVKALSTALSVTIAEAQNLHGHLGDYVTTLADLWKEWLELGAVADGLRARSYVQAGKPSQVNQNRFGPVLPADLISCTTAVRASATCAGNIAVIETRCRSRVQATFRRGEQKSLVKGKWLGEYLSVHLRAIIGSAVVDFSAFSTTYVHSLLDSLNFRGTWADYYHLKLNALP